MHYHIGILIGHVEDAQFSHSVWELVVCYSKKKGFEAAMRGLWKFILLGSQLDMTRFECHLGPYNKQLQGCTYWSER